MTRPGKTAPELRATWWSCVPREYTGPLTVAHEETMTKVQKTVPAFRKQIKAALEPEGAERTGKVTADEMQKALKRLPASKAGVAAAQDLFGDRVKMDGGAQKALKAFIEQHDGTATTPRRPHHGTGVRLAGSVADVKKMLKTADFSNQVITAAFGNVRSKSSSYEVTGVKKAGDGFDLTVTQSHWRTRSMQNQVDIHINAAGVPQPAVPHQPSSPGNGGVVPPPAHPGHGGHGTGVILASTVADVRGMLGSADFTEQMVHAAFGPLRSRSSSYDVGDIRKAGNGFDLTVERRNQRTGDLQDDLVIHINRAGVPDADSPGLSSGSVEPYQPMPGPIGGVRPR